MFSISIFNSIQFMKSESDFIFYFDLPDVMDFSTYLHCLVDHRNCLDSMYFQFNINQGGKLACTRFITPSFDFIIEEV